MNDIIKFCSENALVSSIVAAAILGGIAWLWKWKSDSKDNQAIYDFLQQSRTSTGWDFRTTHAISSTTKIPEDRVSALCGKHPKIRRNQKELQSWCIDEKPSA